MLLLNCAICGKRKSSFAKNQELSNDQFKLNKIMKKFLLTGEKFMSQMHLKEYSPRK